MAQEEKGETWTSEASGSKAARGEDYLESLLIEAFEGKGFEKISEVLQEKELEPPQRYSKSLLAQLDKALRKELDRNEFQNASLLLKCVQLYCKNDLQKETSLFIEQGLVKKVLTDSFNFYLVSWFERAKEFAILIDTAKNKHLMLLLEDIFDSAVVICRCSHEGKKELLNSFLPKLGELVTEADVYWGLRQESLRTLNSILDSVPREERKKFPLSEELFSLTKDLAKTILEVGDYDLQVALTEALCRLMTKRWRYDLVHHWFEDNYLAEAFKEIKDKKFETDCRKFLNQLNERLGNERRVYSLPCISAFADLTEVKRPPDEMLKGFWIDFNTGTQSVTFYMDSGEGALWDSVRLLKEAVRSYSLKEDDGEKILKIYLKVPATLSKIQASTVTISFKAEFDILTVVRKVLGDEKLMTNVAEEEAVPAEKQVEQHEVIPESPESQRWKDPLSSENASALPDSLAPQHSQQLTGTVPQKLDNSGVTVMAMSQQTDAEDANQGSAKESKTPSPRMTAKPSEKPLEEEPMEESTPRKAIAKKKRNRSLVKQRTEGRKDIYDFENSDFSSQEQVNEAKEMILSQKASSRDQRFDEVENKSNHLKRRLSGYRKHLFSESSNDSSSSGPSEKSWILNFQKEPLPELLDYSRKRPRVRSKLKVLPMSSPSSGGEDRSKKEGSRRRAQEGTLRKARPSSSKDEMLSQKLQDGPLLLEVPDDDSSGHEETTQKLHDASDKLSRDEQSFQKKDSGLGMDDTADEVVFAKMLPEDAGDPGVVSAFESFTRQLKKLFWARFKKMEASANNTMKTSEKSLSTLLRQIHECRLAKLETFQKTIVEELTSLEKETQVLASMEKEAMDFWNTQLLKLNSFCSQQRQRIQSVDSGLDETQNFVQNKLDEQPTKKEADNVFFVPPH